MMTQNMKPIEKCGFLACIVMIFMGVIFGTLGAVAAHYYTTYHQEYSLILIAPLIIAIVLGIGLYLGARIGRCGRLRWCGLLLILVFSLFSYSLRLFLDDHYTKLKEKPKTVFDEGFMFAEKIQNLVGQIPYVSNYIQPVKDSKQSAIGDDFVKFFLAVPGMANAPEPVSLGKIFDLALLAPFRGYVEYSGITQWDDKNKQLICASPVVRPWMLWTTEGLFLFLVTTLIAHSGIKKASLARQKRFEKRRGGPFSSSKSSKDKKSPASARLDMTPKPPTPAETEAAPDEPVKKKKGFSLFKRKKETTLPEAAQAEAPKKKRSWFSFGGKKKEKAVQESAAVSSAQQPEMSADQENVRYAIILHQYSQERQDDLLKLIQQVGQVDEARATRLLKVPSLIKRDVSARDASIAIEKFHQVQAQVKLITAEQLQELQKKQPPAQPAPAPKPAMPQGQSSAPQADPFLQEEGERYALVLRKFDPSQKKQVLELLSSLSNTPMTQLQQNLRTPALILRDASKDEVMMIAQQFKMIQAEVKMLTMNELKQLMAKK